jgi:hypothetical protein
MNYFITMQVKNKEWQQLTPRKDALFQRLHNQWH